METIDEQVTRIIVEYYRRNEGRWPDEVRMSPDSWRGLKASDGARSARFEIDDPELPDRWMGVPVTVDRSMRDEQVECVPADPRSAD